MITSKNGVFALLCALAVGFAACGDDESSSGSGGVAGSGGAGGTAGTPSQDCPTIAETWVIEEHCLQGFATEVIPFDQTECDLRVSGAFSGLEGTLDEEGNIALDGALGVMEYACSGTVDDAEMLLTCTDDCPVRLVPE